MASSSVSQESLDMEDFETTRQRNRIRTHRGRGMFYRGGDRDGGDHHVDREGRDQNGEGGDGLSGNVDHDSPTRTAGRQKDKRSRPNHLHKGKLPKDKRKLREKRRSTGVVHLPSTESTGDSLDDDDDDDKVILETKKNTAYNESTSEKNKANHDSHTHHYSSHSHSAYTTRRNKSPSDLEADLEDNQDYDSTVSHSETNLTLIGRSESSDTQMSQSVLNRSGGISKFSRYSPESTKSFTPTNVANTSDQESKTPASSASSSSSILSRYREMEPRHRESGSPYRETESSKPSISKFRDNRTDTSYHGYLSSRFRDRDGSSSHVHSRVNYQVPRPFGSTQQQQNEITANLEKMLEKEKEENKRLQQVLEDKDRRIAELEREVSLLNKELDEVEDENMKLQEDKSALIRAMSQLSTNV